MNARAVPLGVMLDRVSLKPAWMLSLALSAANTPLERIVKASSNDGNIVLDPFAGTFTTCAVAQKLGRQSIGIESELDYVKIGLRRLGIASVLVVRMASDSSPKTSVSTSRMTCVNP